MMVVAGNFYWARGVAAKTAAVPVSGTGSIGDGGLTGKARFQRARGVAARMAAVPVSITTAKMAAILVNERIKR